MISVYRYSYWNDYRGVRQVSRGYATLAAIEGGLGIPIGNASKQVPLSEVVDGMWTPKPGVQGTCAQCDEGPKGFVGHDALQFDSRSAPSIFECAACGLRWRRVARDGVFTWSRDIA